MLKRFFSLLMCFRGTLETRLWSLLLFSPTSVSQRLLFFSGIAASSTDSGMPTVIKDLEKTMHLMAYLGWQVLSYLGNVYEPNRCSFRFGFPLLHHLILVFFCRFSRSTFEIRTYNSCVEIIIKCHTNLFTGNILLASCINSPQS